MTFFDRLTPDRLIGRFFAYTLVLLAFIHICGFFVAADSAVVDILFVEMALCFNMLLHFNKAFSLLLSELTAICAVFIVTHNDHADTEEYHGENDENDHRDPQHALRYLPDRRSV